MKTAKFSLLVTNNGILNDAVFTHNGGSPGNANNFGIYVKTNKQTSSGSLISSTLLDWSAKDVLTNSGVSIPNGGNQFSRVISGFLSH